MEAQRSETEVRLEVNRCIRTISTSRDAVEVVASLRTLAGYLPDGPHARASASEREEFDRAHYTMVLKVLVGGLHADWRQRLTSAEHTELWGAFFLQGPPDQALLVIMDCIGTIGQSSGQDKMVDILELYLQNGRVGALLWSRCQGPGSPDSPQLRETLLGRMVSLPDLMANRLYPHNRPLFLSAQYYSLLAQEFKFALDKTCKALKDGQDCSLRFVAQLLGKTCVQGHSEHLFKDLVPHLSASTRSDMVWQRVCWRLMEDIPDRWMESVVTGLVQVVTGPAALARILGNLVVKNKKSQFVLTHKLLLLQYKYETCVLRTLLGYLAQDRERRPLLIQVLRALCQAWSSSSSVRHTPVEQQLYLSRALLLCVSLLSEAELQELRAELMQCMLGGMQCHLDSNVVRIRRIGMVVGECLSSRLNTQEARLKFEYEQDEETKELVSMMDPFPPEDAVLTDRLDTLQISHCSKDKEMGSPEEPVTLTSHLESQGPPADKGSDSELDSDDELTPYDMSDDREMTKSAPPRYIRDCLEGLIFSEDPTRVELSLQAAEGLVRKNPSAAREVSVELTKVLLHLEDKYSTPSFLALRQAAMVALAVVDSIPVAEYLTTEFYSVNYSLRQRMDILEVLALSAQELSKPIAEQGRPSLPPSAAVTLVDPQSVPSNWRQVVEQRIQSKTRRFGKSGAPAPVTATPNRYASVAGFFFFPLLQSYDRPQVTFDLLGSDHLVLGRLVHTLGLLMHLAVNAPVATQMGRSLLDFVWAIRYHTDQVVRQGVLFSVCAVFLSMPGQCLLAELSDHLLETRAWLADVAEGDADADCRTLAMQALVLLDKSLRTQLEPSALDLKS
ncbi:telomere length regulation protein TEL2 homolog isoform X1 [Scleropages formosus]|uniref:Telomere length regulation protein TEL2 homolog n=1 Tax=Scleropages formosus TaxID=113540 RepID=A0A8C9S9S3_SCLFO|nr:telomere length regulation protein TEL2 homolog isoform X1 [Scleropages formosus]XP_018590562.2 telomere length regulation protein TEL2 homolog isoform X1 [Scleropages formosus]